MLPEVINKSQTSEIVLKRARELGESTTLITHKVAAFTLSYLYKYKVKSVLKKYETLTKLVARRHFINQEIEFIFENFFIVESTVSEIVNSFKRKDVEKLPLVSARGVKTTRLYDLLDEFLAVTDNRVNRDLLLGFLSEYQKGSPLSILEINLVPEVLRLILAENFGSLIDDSFKKIRDFNEADKIHARVKKSIAACDGDPSRAISFLASRYKFIPLDLAIHLLDQLSKEGATMRLVIKWIHLNLEKQGIGVNKISVIEKRNRSKQLSSTSAAIESLHWLNQMRWDSMAEEINVVDAILALDPVGAFLPLERESKNYYRRTVVRIAERVSVNEAEVARAALNLALRARPKDPSGDAAARRHVGYYLMDPSGIAMLEKKMRYVPDRSDNFYKLVIDHSQEGYFGSIAVFVIIVFFFILSIAGIPSLGPAAFIFWLLIAAVFSFEIGIHAANALFSQILPVRSLPRVKIEGDVGDGQRTFVVVPSMLRSELSIKELAQKLEVKFLGNKEENIFFALLFDFKDAHSEILETDAALLGCVEAQINRLNALYGNGKKRFFGLARRRIWNDLEGVFMGWERKRGKLREFNQLLRGKADTSYINGGDVLAVGRVQYVITLDEDTELPNDTARKLIGTIMHPLNAPVVDSSNRIARGYGIIQPRIAVHLDTAFRSIFSRLYSSGSGIDSYSALISNFYQDLFGNALFFGKGIYDIDTIERTMEGKIPENTVLSHDLLEGIYARAGFASDIVIFDGFPFFYHEFIIRFERWIRGDWQLIGWLSNRIGQSIIGDPLDSFSAIDKFKIVDNLRRSLVPVMCVSALILGAVGNLDRFKISALILIVLASPYVFSFVVSLTFLRSVPLSRCLSKVAKGLFSIVAHAVIGAFFLLQQAYVAARAIIVTIIRLYFTRKKLLQWDIFYDVGTVLTGGFGEYYFLMKESVILSLFLLGFIVVFGIITPWLQLWLILWCVAPAAAFLISRPIGAKKRLAKKDVPFVRTVAYRNALYFLENAREETHWLIPDHVQEYPKLPETSRVATSPTNIGMHVIALVSAFDLGYISPLRCADRTEKLFLSLKRLYRYRGHLINWYDIKNLEPLNPQYVSSVDSANFLLNLLTAQQAYVQMSGRMIVEESVFFGLADSISAFMDDARDYKRIAPRSLKGKIQEVILSCRRIADSAKRPLGGGSSYDYFNKLSFFHEGLSGILKKIQEFLPVDRQFCEELLFSIQRAIEIAEDHMISLQALVPYIRHRDVSAGLFASQDAAVMESVNKAEHYVLSVASLSEIAAARPLLARGFEFAEKVSKSSLRDEAKEFLIDWYKKLLEDVDSGAQAAREVIGSFGEIAESCGKYIDEADFTFLYNKEKELFHIGYNITFDKIDSACYNFIASEANSVSFMAILKGDVSQKHWFYLSRKLARSGNLISLVSWGGSLFEYLTSLIFFPVHYESLLGKAADLAIKIQMQDARKHGILWGMGESAYYQFDENNQYQYQIFGSPKIGLKRNLIDFFVVAPYVTALSMPFFPDKAADNLREFTRVGCRGRYGFYDSLDYLGKADSDSKKAKQAKVYYAHHQGFTLASLANVLGNDRIRNLFHSNPMVQSLDILFEEKMPEFPVAEELIAPAPVMLGQNKKSYLRDTGIESKRFIPARAVSPRYAFISNGSYSVNLTSGGASTSLYNGIALTRPSLDEEFEAAGASFFLLDRAAKIVYPLSPRDMQSSHRQKAIFHENKVEFLSFSDSFDSTLSVSVDPRLPVEVRELSIRNNGSTLLSLDLMVYAEVSLAEPMQIFHHPHYHHLLVRAQINIKDNAVIFHRPHPLDRTKEIYCAHMLVSEKYLKKPFVLTASREESLGRFAQGPSFPPNLAPQKNEKALVPLDPASRIVSQIEIRPGERVSVAWVQIAAESDKEIRRLIKKYKNFNRAHTVTLSAISASALATRAMGISQEQSVIFQDIASQVLTGSAREFLYKKSGEPFINSLWKLGISGNYPIALFFIHDIEDMQILKQALQCYGYWKSKGIEIDIVVLNNQPGSYLKLLDDEVDFMIRQAKDMVSKKGGSSIYQVKSDSISSADREAIISIARFVMDGKRGTLLKIVNKKSKFVKSANVQKFVVILKQTERKYPGLAAPDLLFNNSWGGFDKNTGEYVMTVASDRMPPRPWSQIIAFEDFGTVVTDSGSSYTWSRDSHDNRISAWTNEALRYQSGEIIYLRDDDTGEIWNPTPLPVKTKEPFLVRYGFGYASFQNSYSDIEQKLTVFIPPGDTVKVSLLSLKNISGRDRRLTLYHYIEPSTGILRDNNRDRIFCEYDTSARVMLFGNGFRNQMPGRTAFSSFGGSPGEMGWTNDKREFIGRFGSYESPQALKKASLSDSAACRLENCIALSLKVVIPAGEEIKIPIFIGDASSFDEARQIALSWKNSEQCEESLGEVKDFWKQKTNAVTINTGDPSIDILMNGWLLYQALASRIYAKTGFYQPSGAYGFRDQLQDVCALIWSDPAFVREFILKAAAHQFKEGDALNWWHDHNMFGVRTVLSDHQLWLAYALFEYVKATGDNSILEEEVSFLEGPILTFAGKKEWTGIPQISAEIASVFEHAMRAIEKSSELGIHGLPLIGLGDWNDGLSRVGDQGKGESVWVAWFLLRLIDIALPQLKERDQAERMDKFAAVRDAIKKGIDKSAWDNQWYRRAFFDNGTILGSKLAKEFKIDSVAQSWAQLSGHGDEEKIRTAHASMSKILLKDNYFPLIDPALESGTMDPGRIRDYPAGIRENGSQYNHAALWAVQSYSDIGNIDDAEILLKLINPIERSRTEKKALDYGIEPYVVASDVYGGKNAGRGGWSWYSGSAGLMYTTILEHILGVLRSGATLSVLPRVSKSMKEVSITLPCGKSSYRITIKNPKGTYSKVLSASRDNIKCDPSQIPFVDDGAVHQIEVTLG